MPRANLKFPTFPFPYEIARSRRKSLVIYVKGGKVEVRAPLRASAAWINSFLLEKTPWILEQLAEQRQLMREMLVISHNRTVPFLGKPRLIQVIISDRPRIFLTQDKLYMFSPSRRREKLEQLFNDWLKEQAREYMATQTIKYARVLGVQHKLREVMFRKTKSKWGHCCQDGTIQYNWMAMMAPRSVVNYLIAHETSHLRHLNHSQRFWDTVKQLSPNYEELRDWLSDNGHRIWIGPQV